MILAGNIRNFLLTWKPRLPSGHFELLIHISQQDKKGITITVIEGVLIQITKGKMDYFSIMEVRKIISGVHENLGHLLVFSYLVI